MSGICSLVERESAAERSHAEFDQPRTVGAWGRERPAAAAIQNKILEAMAYGLLVATSRAAQALSRGVAEMVETGDTAEEMAAKTVLLLRDFELCTHKGVEGRRPVGVS